MKLHWVRPNDVHITACGIHAAVSVRSITYLQAEASDYYRVAGLFCSLDTCRKCKRINETELPK